MNALNSAIRRELRIAFSPRAQPVWFRVIKWTCILAGAVLFHDQGWFWWTLAGSDRIDQVKDLILSDETEVFVSAASWWVIAIRVSIGKLAADVQTLRIAATQSGFTDLPLLGIHSEILAKLPMLHRDLFGHMIVA